MYKIFIFILIISSILFAKPCMTNIYTGNGIDTSDPQANENMKELSNLMLKYANPAYRLDASKEHVDFNFTYVYNPTYGALEDMQETYHGLLEAGQISKGFFEFMFTLSTLTSTQEEALKQYAKIITTYDIDVSSITKAYRDMSFKKQNNVLLVAHSQGNIVGNKVYSELTSSEKSKFRMVSVGTPADHVAGLKYINEDQHVTGYLDLVINNPFIPNSLPANIDVVGHNFIASYLGRDKGRNAIARLVKTAYNHLDGYTGCSKYDTVYLYVNGLDDTIVVKGKILGTYGTEVISKQQIKSREVDDECKDYSDIRVHKPKLYRFNNDFYSWRIGLLQTQEQVLAHKSAELSYKNYFARCVDISFEDTVYDAVYKALAK